MKYTEKPNNIFTSDDELVEVYQCIDGTWRVAYYPYADKDRNLTREEAFAIAEQRHIEAKQIYLYACPDNSLTTPD